MDLDSLNLGSTNIVEENLDKAVSSKIHIRIQCRNARKSITTVQGLVTGTSKEDKEDMKLLKKKFCQDFSCSGAVKESKEYGYVIQVQGDHREKIKKFLLERRGFSEDNIVVHGF